MGARTPRPVLPPGRRAVLRPRTSTATHRTPLAPAWARLVAAAVCTCPVRAHGPVRWTEGPQPRSPGAWRGGGRPGLIAHGPRGRRRQRATTASRAGTSRSGARRCLLFDRGGEPHQPWARGGVSPIFGRTWGGVGAGVVLPRTATRRRHGGRRGGGRRRPPCRYHGGVDCDADATAVEQQLPPLWLVALTLEQWSSSCRPFALPLAPAPPSPR